WIFCYFYVMAAAIRLARFNITQAGRAKRYFIGLPSPAAGMTLATFFPFTTTELYQHVFRFMPRHHLMQLLIILLTMLMVSNVRYATFPRAGLRTLKGLLGLATILFILVFGILEHDAFFFPLGITYMVYGILRATLLGFFFEEDDDETLGAARAAGSDAYFVWHRDTDLRQADVVILPGGFSYGDYLRSGAIARFSAVMGAVAEHAYAGGAVLGICNGFQILCEAGLLPGALMRNARLRFLSRPVWVRVEQTDTPFTSLYEKGEVLEIPVAHGDGRYVVDPRTAAELEATDRVVLRYVRENPNGSTNEIAGVTNAGRNVVGIMPHPERRDAPALGGQDGARVFPSMEARHATQHAVDARAVDDRHLRV